MTQTFRRADGLEVEAKPSLVAPKSMCVLIAGPSLETVHASVVEILIHHRDARFTAPVLAADGSWTTFGRVPL